MQIRCNEAVRRLDETTIEAQSDLVYLGTAISDDGRVGRELVRRLGMASSEFRSLASLWRHTSLAKARKAAIFNAAVVSIFLYSLSTVCLNTAERRRLDGFQNRCLRRIWGVQPAFPSRVRNVKVLESSQQRPLSGMLEEQQLLLFGKVAMSPNDSVIKSAVFQPSPQGRFWPGSEEGSPTSRVGNSSAPEGVCSRGH